MSRTYSRVRIVEVGKYWKYHVYAKTWLGWKRIHYSDSLGMCKDFCERLSTFHGLHNGSPILEEYVRTGTQLARDCGME